MTPTDPFGEYVFVHGEWRWNVGVELPDAPTPVAAEAPKVCPVVKKNGQPCSGNPTVSGLCVGHKNQRDAGKVLELQS